MLRRKRLSQTCCLRVSSFGALALATSVLLSQTPTPNPKPPASGPLMLVRMNVVALDKGQPAADLTRDDFTVSDQGKPQTIVFFRRNEGAPETQPPGPGEYANRPGGALPHSTVILFDLLNQNQPDRLDTWRRLGRSLPQLESGDSVYFYLLTLEGTLNPIHPIGGKSGDDQTWPRQVEKILDKAMKNASHARPAGMGDEEVVKKTYVALETLGNQLAAIPGRRDIVWITGGVPNVWNPKSPCNGDWIDCALYVPHLSVTLDRDAVAVNPLSYSSSQTPSGSRDIEQMATLTGGRTYFGDDIRAVVKQVTRDSVGGYSIAYEPQPDNWDNQFHKIRVTCERKGIKLQVRQRYYALPDQRPPQARQQAALGAAFQNPSDTPDIGLRAKVSLSTGSQSTAHLEIRINPADLLLREDAGQFNCDLALVLSGLGANGPVGEPAASYINLHLTREQRDMVLKEGVPISKDYPLNAAIQKIRLLVLDQGTNTVGALTIPIPAAR